MTPETPANSSSPDDLYITKEQLKIDLENAADYCVPVETPIKVNVLALHFSNAEQDLKDAEHDLLEIMWRVYHFNIQVYEIDIRDPRVMAYDLKETIQDFIREDEDLIEDLEKRYQILNIVIFSGHSWLHGHTLHVGGDTDHVNRLVGPIYPWGSELIDLESITTRVLVLFDTPDSGAQEATRPEHGAELLALTGLTKTLTQKLRTANGKPRTIAEIYGELHREHLLEGTPHPVHIPSPESASIVLEKIASRFSSIPTNHVERLRNIASQDEKVLVKVNISDMSGFGAADWRKWLLGYLLPAVKSAGVGIQSASILPSGLLVVELPVPVEVFTMLPPFQPAYKIVKCIRVADDS